MNLPSYSIKRCDFFKLNVKIIKFMIIKLMINQSKESSGIIFEVEIWKECFHYTFSDMAFILSYPKLMMMPYFINFIFPFLFTIT